MVYGHYYKTIKKVNIRHICPNCGSKQMQWLKVTCKVSHCMFIPSYASQKNVITSCELCNTAYYIPKDSELYNQSQKILKDTKYPIWLYLGSILFVILCLVIACLIIMGQRETQKDKSALIGSAKAGYLITKKLDDHQKTSMLIIKVTEDTLFVRENMYSTNSDVYDISDFENFSPQINSLSMNDLRQMIEQGEITDIKATTLTFSSKITE